MIFILESVKAFCYFVRRDVHLLGYFPVGLAFVAELEYPVFLFFG